jgi:hypothetical protein
MNALAELLSAMEERPGKTRKQSLSDLVVIERLKERAAEMAAPNTFKVGDIVTPKPDAGTRGFGEPHIITRINEEGFPKGTYESGQNNSSVTYNVEIISMHGDTIFTHVAAHWQFTHYQPKD